MKIDPLYIKYFPFCEDVFETDVELAKKALITNLFHLSKSTLSRRRSRGALYFC